MAPAHPAAFRQTIFASLTATCVLSLIACSGQIVRQGGQLENVEGAATRTVQDMGEFPWQGEQIQYTVQHAGLKTDVLDLSVAVGHESVADDGTSYIPIGGFARSISIARMIARVDDSAETYIDPATWRPIYAVKDLDENERHRTYHVWYWPDELTAEVEKHKDNRISKKKVAVPRDTLDAVSFIYHLRTIDLSEAEQRSWYVYDGWIISKMTVVVGDIEEIWTPLGFYDARRIDVYREKLEGHVPQGAFAGVYATPEMSTTKDRYFFGNIWLGTDDDRIPVRLAVETRIGDLELLLQGYQPPTPIE